MICCCSSELPPAEEAIATEALPPRRLIQEEYPTVVEEPETVLEPAPAPEEPKLAPEPAPMPEPEPPKEAEQPRGESEVTEWEVSLEMRDKSSLGVSLDTSSPNSLAIKNVKTDGLIEQWNVANPMRKIERGDAIIAVNGGMDKKTMLDNLKNKSSLTLLIRRVPEFVVQVNKSEGPVGITLSGPGDNVAQISSIADGKGIHQYNVGAEPGKVVTPGHLLVEANGETGNQEKIIRVISRGPDTMVLKFRHAAVGAAH